VSDEVSHQTHLSPTSRWHPKCKTSSATATREPGYQACNI